jgi:DNA-binding NarL/FixJ family response regulator
MDGVCEDMVAVICDDRPALRDAVLRLVMACGFDVPAVTQSFTELIPLTMDHEACLVVVALPLTGMSGLRAVRELSTAAPDCEIVLLSPSSTLELAALEAGARALVPEDDLRVLRDVVLEIAAAPRRLRLPQARPQSEPVVRGRSSTKPSA